MATPVVTFDAGQTLVDLDLDFLARRLGERGAHVPVSALHAAAPAAWHHYEALVAHGGGKPWQALMTTLLGEAGVAGAEGLVEWLWAEQPTRNLWRRPIADMVALARELAGRGVIVAILSNSEGRLAELLDEIGIASAFAAIIDSGRIGLEKPDPRIFTYALDQLGGSGSDAVHVGDSWAADIVGARGAGWRAVWYRSHRSQAHAMPHDPGVRVAADAGEVRTALAAFGI